MSSKRIELKLLPKLLQTIDAAANANYTSRSEFIRESVIMRLNNQHLVYNPRQKDTLELLKQTKGKAG